MSEVHFSPFGKVLLLQGFGGIQENPLGVALVKQARQSGVEALVPELVVKKEGYVIVPPIGIQADMPDLQAALEQGPDVIISHSASHTTLREAIDGTSIPSGQRLVALTPSARQPTEFVRQPPGRAPDDEEKKLALTFRDIYLREPELDELTYAQQVEAMGQIALILPGGNASNGRPIAVTNGYMHEIQAELPIEDRDFQPARFLADLLNLYGAEISVYQVPESCVGLSGPLDMKAVVINGGKDLRLRKQEEDLKVTRRALEQHIGEILIPHGTHMMTGFEKEIVSRILSGSVFADAPTAFWSSDGVQPVLARR